MTTPEDTYTELLIDQQATTDRTVVPKSCYFYRYKEEEGKVTSCDGDVTFVAGEFLGTCGSCGRQVPLIAER